MKKHLFRIKLTEELDAPIKKLEKENEKLDKEKERLINELKLTKQQMEHMEKENLDSLEKIKLSYEVEINTIKREKEEIRNRLVEASQVPEVKRLIDLSEDNSKLNRKLQSAQELIEQAEQKYKIIQQQLEELMLEQDRKEKINDNNASHLQEQIVQQKQENKILKNTLNDKSFENEELLKEIGRLKRIQEKLKFDLEQQKTFFDAELEAITNKMNNEIKTLNQTKDVLKDEIKSKCLDY